jgi:hypothetical protein
MKQGLWWAALLFAAWQGHAYFADRPVQAELATDSDAPVDVIASAPPPTASFQCDGRTHCSQMTSRAEAEFFVRHCPGTRMDGNHDGEPCENDSRF